LGIEHPSAPAAAAKLFPLGASDLEGAAVFVFELEAFGNAVIGLGLPQAALAAQGGFFQYVGQERGRPPG
jgi:hypothetical protein